MVILAVCNSEILTGAGANLLANVWGPVLGAKVVKYRTVVLIGIAGQVVGIVIFGPRTASVYNGILYDWTKLKPYPELTLYAMAWAEVTLVTWQYLAIWKQVLIPVYLGAGIVRSCTQNDLVLRCNGL